MNFHENLRCYREKAGYTTKQISDLLGITSNTYAGYEIRGRQPKYQTLTKIADLLHVSTDELLGAKDKKYTPKDLDRLAIRNRIMLEVDKQERQWGDEKELSPFEWQGLILEEIGETAQAINERFLPDEHKSKKKHVGKYDIENEAYQTIALLFRFIEYLHEVNKNEHD